MDILITGEVRKQPILLQCDFDEVLYAKTLEEVKRLLFRGTIGVCLLDASFFADSDDSLQDMIQRHPETEFCLFAEQQELKTALEAMEVGCRFYLPYEVEETVLEKSVRLASSAAAAKRELLEHDRLWKQNHERLMMSFWKDAVFGVFSHGSFEDARSAAIQVGITLEEDEKYIIFMFTFGPGQLGEQPKGLPNMDPHHKFLRQVFSETILPDQGIAPIFPINQNIFAALFVLTPGLDVYDIRTRCNHFMLECESKLSGHFFCISEEPISFMDFDVARVNVMINELNCLLQNNTAYRFTNELIANISTYVRENVCNGITCKQVADHFFLHPNYLSRYFKTSTGVKLSQYILDQKLDAAKDMLKDTDEQIGAISERLGFNNLSYFSKVFKMRSGVTPKNYRIIHKSYGN